MPSMQVTPTPSTLSTGTASGTLATGADLDISDKVVCYLSVEASTLDIQLLEHDGSTYTIPISTGSASYATPAADTPFIFYPQAGLRIHSADGASKDYRYGYWSVG